MKELNIYYHLDIEILYDSIYNWTGYLITVKSVITYI